MSFLCFCCKDFLLASPLSLSLASELKFLNKSNPRDYRWTAVYRRLNKKGAIGGTGNKRRKRRVQRVQRSIVGISIDALKAKRNESDAVRQAARDQAARKLKEQKKARAEAAAAKRKAAPAPAKQKAAKIVPKGGKGGKAGRR